MPWHTSTSRFPECNLRPSSLQHTLDSKEKHSNPDSFSLFPSLPFVSSISNICLESQGSYSVKAVHWTHHRQFYRSPARQWWFVLVLRQNYSLLLSQYRLLPLSGTFPLADTQKRRKHWGGGGVGGGWLKEFHSTALWIADVLSDNLVRSCHCQSQSHQHVWFWWSQALVGTVCCQSTVFHGLLSPISIQTLLFV